MKDQTRRRLSELILEELSDKIKVREGLRTKLEAFVDLPVEKVADALLRQFEYILSSELRDLIIHLIRQDMEEEEAALMNAQTAQTESGAESHIEIPIETAKPEPASAAAEAEMSDLASKPNEDASAPPEGLHGASIMEHFSTKEAFPSVAMEGAFEPTDWFCIYGFSYAPDSSGKGIPRRLTTVRNVDHSGDVILMDYGDIRLYMSRLNPESYTLDRSGQPVPTSQRVKKYAHEHESILNTLRQEEVMVVQPFWTVVQGKEAILKLIEDRYVELLRALIDVHDAEEWELETFVLDEHIMKLPSIASAIKGRSGAEADNKRRLRTQFDEKVLEKVFHQEKTIAQELHSYLLPIVTKAKIDYMIRLDSAFMDDWKSILSVRYNVGKDKRKAFWQRIATFIQRHADHDLMVKVNAPAAKFTLRA
jgi:hypothetical protein